MDKIKIKIDGRIAEIESAPEVVTDNAEYEVEFAVDERDGWNPTVPMTALFVRRDARYTAVVMDAGETICTMPPQTGTNVVYVGLTQDDMRTTTPAAIKVQRSIRTVANDPLPAPTEDVYAQILAAYAGTKILSGKGAPTSATVGRLNQLYRDESTDKLYICTGVEGGYTWAAVVSDTEDAVTYTAQTLTEEQKTQARANIGAGTSNFSGLYNDLPDKPNIPAATVIDTTLSKSGQAADAKAAGDAIGKKLDKAQGTGNAGKILGIGADGNVTPQNKPVQALAGGAAPTTATAGVVGQEYYVIVDNAVTEMYVCTSALIGSYTWDKVEFGGATTTEQKTKTVSVGTEPVTLDATAAEQTVNLIWNVPGSKTIPAFTNYYSNLNGKTYPRELNAGYNQFWSNVAGHGNGDSFVSGHKYFIAMKYEMDGESTAKYNNITSNYITPTNSAVLSGAGWIYELAKPYSVSEAGYYINELSGTGRVYYCYCIDVTALQDAGTITATTVNELADLFGGLELIPGQNYAGSTTSGTATLTITRNGTTSQITNAQTTATVKGGDSLIVSAGTVTFQLTVTETVVLKDQPWKGKKWVAFGDSLTDATINATKKYYKYIEEKSGITVAVLGVGGNGYYKSADNGTAYYQRMANCPSDADIITIFGSVNDWVALSQGTIQVGTASDTLENGTYAGYINKCIDVAIEKAPYAQIALVTPTDYHGLPSDTLETIASTIKAVAVSRKIKCLDLYHESGFRVNDATYAAQYTTDYSPTAETYGHPSNLAHEKLIAPEFMELLKRMLLTM